MAEQRWVIFAAGEWCEQATIDPWLHGASTVVACDGALALCLERNILPDMLVGDGDSIDLTAVEAYVERGGSVQHFEGQDENDLTKALLLAEQRGATSCTVFGSTGGDRQHEWANLLACAASSLEVICLDDRNEYRFLKPSESYSIDFEVGREFSLYALPSAQKVSLSGCAYSLDNEVLHMGSRGLHNRAVEPIVRVHYKAGRLMMIRPHVADGVAGTTEAS